MQLNNKLWLTALIIVYLDLSATQNVTDLFRSINSFKSCIGDRNPVLCVKEKALDALNETIMSDEPMRFFDTLTIERNPDYLTNETGEDLPQEASARSIKLTNILYDRIEDFFKSRTLKLNLAPAFEGNNSNHPFFFFFSS